MDISNGCNAIEYIVKQNIDSIKSQMVGRGVSASNELRNSVLHILAGQRSGRVYKVPATKQKYTASAPGEAPANRTGTLRNSYRAYSLALDLGNEYEIHSTTDSQYKTPEGYLLGDMLEKGTKRIAPRPFKLASLNRALPYVLNIYKRKY